MVAGDGRQKAGHAGDSRAQALKVGCESLKGAGFTRVDQASPASIKLHPLWSKRNRRSRTLSRTSTRKEARWELVRPSESW